MQSKSLQEHIDAAVSEEISIVPYNSEWPLIFEREAQYLRDVCPRNLLVRLEHFGSTAIPGMSAKPIIDILAEVVSLVETRTVIVPILESFGYDYFWRPEFDSNDSAHYAWFIKRDSQGKRLRHIHMVEADSGLWDRLYFRDYLRQFEDEAKTYAKLKIELAQQFPNDRIAYTKGKTAYITSITQKAKSHYLKTTI